MRFCFSLLIRDVITDPVGMDPYNFSIGFLRLSEKLDPHFLQLFSLRSRGCRFREMPLFLDFLKFSHLQEVWATPPLYSK